MAYETFKCGIKSPKRKQSVAKKPFLMPILICLSLTLMYNFQILPALIPFAKATISTEITKTVQSAIKTTIMNGEYSDFIKLSYSNDGTVTALETNYANIARTTAKISEAVTNVLCNNDIITVKIPLGTLSGGAILAGKGPNLKFKVKVSPQIAVNVENEFYESGINQTLHRIIAKIDVKSYALLPFSPREIEMPVKFLLAETVIIGKVPDAYTKINRLDDELSESDIDDIYDFGATLK